LLGVAGAVVGGFVGMMGWYFLIKATHYEIGYAAWGVGALAGVGARILGHSGSTLLGVSAGVCALLAIIGGQFFAAKSVVNEIFEKGAKEAYETQLAYAKEAVQALPTGSDAEIKAFLTKEAAKEGGGSQGSHLSETCFFSRKVLVCLLCSGYSSVLAAPTRSLQEVRIKF